MTKLYRYYFDGCDKPITIQSNNKQNARAKLEEVCNQEELVHQGYTIANLLKETTETLVIGVSFKEVNNKKIFWNGKGWSKKNK
jgi:dsRNA-specific ribonuclease